MSTERLMIVKGCGSCPFMTTLIGDYSRVLDVCTHPSNRKPPEIGYDRGRAPTWCPLVASPVRVVSAQTGAEG